jgi:hypothetical protein
MIDKGKLCLYYLNNQTILFSECASQQTSEKGDTVAYIFDASKTLVVQPVKQGNHIELSANKFSDSTFKPSAVVVPLSSVTLIQDCCDEMTLMKLRAGLAGIIMPGKN